MSEAKFTKGLWTMYYKPQHRYRITADERRTTICDVAIWLTDHDENTANAYLIAAAPDLYEALDNLRRMGPLYSAMVQADAALAKARGET